jgi:integrase
MNNTNINFTEERLRDLEPPDTGEVIYRDVKTPGLSVRVRAGGSKVYSLRYRLGGRGSIERRLTLGDVGALPLAEARKIAVNTRAQVANGRDPAGERQEAADRARASAAPGTALADIIDAWERDRAGRELTSATGDAGSLRREFAALLNRDPASVTRAEIVGVFGGIREDGRGGAVANVRSRIHGLLSWAANEGLIPLNPMDGYRKPRRSRAERVAAVEKRASGIMLDMAEIAALWRACDDSERVRPAFGAYVKLLILSGCRRGEMAQARLSWIKPATSDKPAMMTIPAKLTKSGRAHVVPLPALAQGVIAGVKRYADTDLVTPGAHRAGKTAEISGWSKSWPALLRAAEKQGLQRKPALHDLRKSFRSHLARLGVADRVAEAMLNHAPTDRLIAIYDKHDRIEERIEAAEKWADEVAQALAEPLRDVAEVVTIGQAREVAHGRRKGAHAA